MKHWPIELIRPRDVTTIRSPRDLESLREGRAWVGYLSYDIGRIFEPALRPLADSPQPPLGVFANSSSVTSGAKASTARRDSRICSTFTRERYLRAVQKCIDYIAAGDVYQVNLSQRFTVSIRDEPRAIYDRLQLKYPAAFGAFLDFGDFQIISNSPELFLRVTPDRKIVTRPIKGTRPFIPGMDIELRESAKDQAELAMIVDLERNDLGRICHAGSVRVTEPRAIEAHRTVYHGVATIEGTLRDDVTLTDILRATFPSGSVTGAPKIRAMQIIDELEPVARGPYCGAIGWIGADGTMEFNVAIRTMVIRDGIAHISVGGGIVADSHPQAEYEETLVKARAMFEALGVNEAEIRAITQ